MNADFLLDDDDDERGDGGGGSNNNSSDENGIAVVATRIRERALELASERSAVELAKAERDDLQRRLDEETKVNNAIRRTMLSTVRSRHGVELELWKIRDDEQERLAKLDEYQRETEQANEETTKVHDAWEDVVRDLYVEHELQRELYKRAVESRIKRREKLIQERDQRLRQLEQERKTFEETTKRMVEETKQLEQSIVDMDSREEKEDEEVAALSMNIRNTIAKRTSLRRAVRDAEEACHKANAEMKEWEQKRLQATNPY